MMARLADGVPLEAAAAEIEEIASSVRGRRPAPDASGQPRFQVVGVEGEIGEPVRPALLCLPPPSHSSC